MVYDVAGTELDFVVTRIHFDLLGPDRDDVGIFVLIDPDKKIFLIRRQVTQRGMAGGICSGPTDFCLKEDGFHAQGNFRVGGKVLFRICPNFGN